MLLAWDVVVFRVGVAAPGLQIGLQRHSLGVGGIFLHGWIRLGMAVRYGVGRFASFSIIVVEKWQNVRFSSRRGPRDLNFKTQIGYAIFFSIKNGQHQ